MQNIHASKYATSFLKRLVDISFSLLAMLFMSPIFIAIVIIILFTSGRPVFFVQKRCGFRGKKFKIIKFRSMVKNAPMLQKKYKNLNQSDGPAFKINNDPRFTKFGKFLSRTGFDELPQFLNVIKGDMSVVGPRPLPFYEASMLKPSQRVRQIVKPGITSNWVAGGSHTYTFEEWMNLDREYVVNASLIYDLQIMYKTYFLMVVYLIKQIRTIDLGDKKN